MYFSLAKEFKWLPDEIDRQEPKKIKGIMHMLSIYNSIQNNLSKQPPKTKRPTSRGGKQYIDITDPKVEKSLAEGTYKV